MHFTNLIFFFKFEHSSLTKTYGNLTLKLYAMLIDNGIVEYKVFDKFYYLKKVFRKCISMCLIFL